jgi:integrase
MGKEGYRLARHRGRFAVVWYEDGCRRRCSLGTNDRAQAESQLIEFKRIRSVQATEGPLDVRGIYQAYQESLKARPSYERVGHSWKPIGRAFGNLLPSQLTRAAVEDFTENRLRHGKSRGTIHLELGYLRAALRFARREGFIREAPYIPLPQKPPPKDHRLSRQEARRLIDAVRVEHVRLFIILAIATAGRASAILELTWDRVDFGRARIDLSSPERQRTNKKRAMVPMNDMARQALQEAKQAALTEYVIEWGGKRVMSVKKGVAAAARRAGVKCSPHVLRHTAACILAESGVPMEEIAQYLGHSNTDTTRRIYARYSPDYLQKAARSLEL